MTSEKMNYSALIDAISRVHKQSQAGAAGAVNRFLVLRNWLIGFYLIEFEQNGKDRAKYGTGLLDYLSCDLRERGVNGLGVSMLKNCRQFYKTYPQFRQPVIGEFGMLGENSAIRQPVIGEFDASEKSLSVTKGNDPKPLSIEKLFSFSWTHFIEFIHLEEPWKRAFYENDRAYWEQQQTVPNGQSNKEVQR